MIKFLKSQGKSPLTLKSHKCLDVKGSAPDLLGSYSVLSDLLPGGERLTASFPIPHPTIYLSGRVLNLWSRCRPVQTAIEKSPHASDTLMFTHAVYAENNKWHNLISDRHKSLTSSLSLY